MGDGVEGKTFLDIGGGVGSIQLELMAAGAHGGTSIEASPSYVRASRAEADARGHASRIRYVAGDFVERSAEIEAADLVSLDWVVCCYPDMPALVDASAARARWAYGLVYPRDRRITRWGVAFVNFLQRIRRHPFRAHVHPTAAVEARLEEHGLTRVFHAQTILWQVAVFRRPRAASGGA